MAMIETWFNQDLREPVHVQYLDGNVFSQDNLGNLIGVHVFDDGEPAVLSGSVAGNVIRSDGGTVPVTGMLSGNDCYIILPAAAYSTPGPISIIIKLTGGGSTVTLCAVVANVYQASTDTPIDPGTIIPDVNSLIAAIDAAIASIPPDYDALVKDVNAINDEINGKVFNFGVTSVSGWIEQIISSSMALKKGDYVTIEAEFSPAVSSSTYLYLKDGDTQLTYSQCNGLSAKTITYKLTADAPNFRITTNSESYTGDIRIALTVSSRQTQVEENKITAHELADETPGYYSLQRLSPFIRGGYDYPDFNYNTYQISSKNVITAPFPMYMRVKSGFHAKILTVSGDTATNSGWQTTSLFAPSGSQFVIKIERATPDTTEVADIEEFLSAVTVFSDYIHWYDIKRFSDEVITGQTINVATGAAQSGGGYYFVYLFKNPAFKFIKLDASLYDRNVAAIAFYSSETIDANSYISGMNQGAWVEHNFVYAQVPDNCKLVCVCSRNVYGDNTAHIIGVYSDDATRYIENEVFYKTPPLSLFKDYKYVYHFNANHLGTAEIPLNSLHDIDVAARLGFKAYEINARETATPGYYVCMHGNSGKIGTELVARNGTDISDIAINTVTKQTFEEDYIYNTTVPELQTPVTSLENAIKRCRKYGMFPFISWAGYQSISDIRKWAGNDFVIIIYDQYYIGRTAFKGAFVLYKTLTDADFAALMASVEKPFIFNFTTAEISNLTDVQKAARIQSCRENNCIIGAAGVYQTAAQNMALLEMGVDYLASGWEVENFTNGNLLSINNFSDFTHTGTISGGVLALSDEGYIQSIPSSGADFYLSKAALKIRFSGTLNFDFGDYITNESITSDGSKDVVLTTAFYKDNPAFKATADGAVNVYSCIYDASIC